MRFLGSKSTQNALAAGPDPAEGAKALPRPSSRFKGAASRRGKGMEEKEGGGWEGEGT